jgi:hypothetical protein
MAARRMWIAALMVLGGCAWVTNDEYLDAWDADGDGFSLEVDCAADNANIYPGAPDFRGDGCDADCGNAPDADGDDWPNDADCNPTDPNIFPCNPAEVAGDGKDLDCDGRDEPRTDACPTRDPSHADVEAPDLTSDCATGGDTY